MNSQTTAPSRPSLVPAGWRLVDHDRCQSLPLRSPGAVQDQGWLIAIDRVSRRVSHASANLPLLASRALGSQQLLGCDLDHLVATLKLPPQIRAMNNFEKSDLPLAWLGAGQFVLGARSTADHLIVEIEPDLPSLAPGFANELSGVLTADNWREFAEQMVQVLGDRFGYDRTMAYQLHQDLHGEIIAEHLSDPSMESFLGMHYPASDIPPQARELYLMQLARVIADVDAPTVDLLRLPDGADARAADAGHFAELDLSYSSLRAVSPVHLEYLRNMGVSATATVSVVQHDRLVGMFVMHHLSERTLGRRDRETLTALSRLTSFVSTTMDERVRSLRRTHVHHVAVSLREQLSHNIEGSLSLCLERSAFDLVKAVDADGVIVRLGSEIVRFGQTPPVDQVDHAVRGLNLGELTAVTDDLGDRFATLAHGSNCGGALIRRLPGTAEAYMAWFRRPQSMSINWGGNPTELVFEDEGGRLHPRASFAVFLEETAHRSRPWSESDQEAAHALYQAAQAGLLERSYRDLASHALVDSLTGLGNRAALSRAIDLAQTTPAVATRPMSLLFLDLDKFKQINDTFGHEQGDLVLQAAANRLSEVVRLSANGSGEVFRLGGDEFVVLLHDLEQSTTAATADAIVEAFRLPLPLGEVDRVVNVSVGMVVAVDEGLPSAELLRRGDLAMYAAKRSGGSQTAFYSEEHARRAVEQSVLERQLHHALTTDQLCVAYQPLVSLNGRRAVGAEALVRWRRDDGELISPVEFIGLAERTGQIVDLDRLMIRVAVEECATLLRDLTNEFHLAVNVSSKSLDQGYISLLSELVTEHQFPPDRLMIEIAESALATEQERLSSILQEIRSLSVKVAIDDFGTGISSLASLQHLCADVVKLDGTFVSRLSDSHDDQVVPRWFIQLIEELGLRVIAEGVETKQQEAILASIGYDWVQGYRYGLPVLAPPRIGAL